MSMPRKADAADYLRRRAITLLGQGHKQCRVASLLGVSVRSIRRWTRIWQKGGAAGLASLATPLRPGRPPRLSEPQAEQVLSWISQDPTEFGFPTGWWTAPRLADLVRRRFNVSMNHRYLNHWLRHRHISPQIPEAQPAERDQIRIDAWVRWQWPWIKRQAQALRATLGFTDETGFLLCPLIRSTQAPTGHTPLLLHRAKQRDKVSAVGALTLSPQQGHVGLYFQTYPNDYVNNDLYALFLRALLWQIRGPLVLLHDGGGMHKGDPVREVQADYPRLHIHPFPPYAPELNPPEYLWNHAKHYRLANFVPTDVPEIDRTVTSLLHEIRHDQERLKTFFRSSPLPWKNTTLPI
jgi:transposase